MDPLSDGWLVDGEGLVAEDDVHLTAAGQGALADLMRPVVEGTLAGDRRRSSGQLTVQ